jgi:hypothetical protein
MNTILLKVTTYSVVDIYKRFVETKRQHLQGNSGVQHPVARVSILKNTEMKQCTKIRHSKDNGSVEY